MPLVLGPALQKSQVDLGGAWEADLQMVPAVCRLGKAWPLREPRTPCPVAPCPLVPGAAKGPSPDAPYPPHLEGFALAVPTAGTPSLP